MFVSSHDVDWCLLKFGCGNGSRIQCFWVMSPASKPFLSPAQPFYESIFIESSAGWRLGGFRVNTPPEFPRGVLTLMSPPTFDHKLEDGGKPTCLVDYARHVDSCGAR